MRAACEPSFGAKEAVRLGACPAVCAHDAPRMSHSTCNNAGTRCVRSIGNASSLRTPRVRPDALTARRCLRT